MSQSEAARTYGVSQGWISRLMTRYAAEGKAAFEARSRAPRTHPTATALTTVELVLQLHKPSRNGSAPNHSSHARSASCRRCWTPSPTSTTTPGRTALCPTGPRRPPPTRPGPKPSPAPTAPATPTTGSATTPSAKPAPSPCASPDSSATSASAEPTPEPTSPCSSKTSTSASSTPPPATSYANSSSTHDATTSPPAGHPDDNPKRNNPNLQSAGSSYSDVLRHHSRCPRQDSNLRFRLPRATRAR